LGYDIGGNFTTVRNYYDQWSNKGDIVHAASGGFPFNTRYDGKIFAYVAGVPGVNIGAFPDAGGSSDFDLYSAGTKAVSMSKPTNPIGNMSNALGELYRDGLPFSKGMPIPGAQAMKRQAQFYKELGPEYLNVEFGWAPFVADIRKAAWAIKHHNKVIDQYIRDSGKQVRRRFQLPNSVDTSVATVGGSTYPQPTAIPTTLYTNRGTLTKTIVARKEQWFSGAFTYYLALGPSTTEKMMLHEQLANKLLGSRITPETLWQLTPWSWLADWFTNLGSVIHNLSDFLSDGAVLQYGYIMETSDVYHQYDRSGVVLKGVPGVLDLHQRIGSIRKVRRRATPFGFGLTGAAFTSRQWAIIGALGLSQSSGRLSW
jgi:hypothetical protein